MRRAEPRVVRRLLVLVLPAHAAITDTRRERFCSLDGGPAVEGDDAEPLLEGGQRARRKPDRADLDVVERRREREERRHSRPCLRTDFDRHVLLGGPAVRPDCEAGGIERESRRSVRIALRLDPCRLWRRRADHEALRARNRRARLEERRNDHACERRRCKRIRPHDARVGP